MPATYHCAASSRKFTILRQKQPKIVSSFFGPHIAPLTVLSCVARLWWWRMEESTHFVWQQCSYFTDSKSFCSGKFVRQQSSSIWNNLRKVWQSSFNVVPAQVLYYSEVKQSNLGEPKQQKFSQECFRNFSARLKKTSSPGHSWNEAVPFPRTFPRNGNKAFKCNWLISSMCRCISISFLTLAQNTQLRKSAVV